MNGKVYLLTGQPGTGKTTLAEAMKAAGIVDTIIDGHEVRTGTALGYSREDRLQNVDRAYAVARYLGAAQGLSAALTLNAPYAEQRDAMKADGVVEIYMAHPWAPRPADWWVGDYEVPENGVSPRGRAGMTARG